MFVIFASLSGMLLCQWCSSELYQAIIESHWFSQMGFWLIICFYCVKIVVSCWTYAVWRRDFRYLQGHVDCCRGYVPARQMSGGLQEPMIDSDPERGAQNNNRPLPFQGQGVAIGGGGGQQQAYGWNQNPALYAQPNQR